MPHLNKSQKRQQRMNIRHPQTAIPNAEINNLNNLSNSNSFTNPTFIAGPTQAAEEIVQLPDTKFPINTAVQLEQLHATGEPQEAIQQAFKHRGIS